MTKFNNFIKSRTFIITLTITFIFLILVGVTYAWYTWTSTDNTNITMQIGETTVVTYVGGNAINVNNLTPVYSYTNEPSTTFTLTNNNTNNLKIFKYNVYLDITSIASELISPSLKFVLLDGSSNVVDQGSFSTASTGSTLTITENQTLPSSTSSYTFIIYLDANEQSNTNMMNKSLSGTLRVTVVRSEAERHLATPIDFEYALFNNEDTEYADDYIVLTSYIANYPILDIPNTFVIAGREYKVAFYKFTNSNTHTSRGTFTNDNKIYEVSLPDEMAISYKSAPNDSDYTPATLNLTYNTMDSLFNGCTNLVSIQEIPSGVTNMSSTFKGCTSLVNPPVIPSSVTNMYGTFSGCASLVSAPVIPNGVTDLGYTFYGCTFSSAPTIPNSVTNMYGTFSGCASLVNVPTIPNGVTNMNLTFYNCTSLVNVPAIPNSVTSMQSTFYNCTSLVNAPTIGTSVTDMYETFRGCTSLVTASALPSSVSNLRGTFWGCTNLTGTIRINSSAISGSSAYQLFLDTVKPITVEVPAGSTTYTAINNNKPANVTVTTFTP